MNPPACSRASRASFLSEYPTRHNPFSFRAVDFLWLVALCPYLPLFLIPTIPQPLAIDFRLVYIIYKRTLSPLPVAFGAQGIGHWTLGPWPLDFRLFCIAFRAPKPIYSLICRTSSWIVARGKENKLDRCCSFRRRLAIQSHATSYKINRAMSNNRKQI